MTTVDEFAARLNAAGRNLDRLSKPILSAFGDVVAESVSANAPKRTRRRPGPGLKQVRPGVLELPAGSYLVGELRGTSQRAPQSRSFLADSIKGARRPMAEAVARIALGVVASEVGASFMERP